ncbi:MAG: hypothetical protein V8R27_03835 [Oscillospiraceae bacterium]
MALSRRFGVPVGWLLGVEDPGAAPRRERRDPQRTSSCAWWRKSSAVATSSRSRS